MSVEVEGFEDIGKVIDSTVTEICENIDSSTRSSAEEARLRAEMGFAFAEYPGDNDVEVEKTETQSGDSYTIDITASGNAVTFIEFGTGVRYVANEHPLAAENGMIRGEYGQGRGASPKGWLYRGIAGNSDAEPSTKVPGLMHTYGNPAAMAMYNAANEMERKIDEGIDRA